MKAQGYTRETILSMEVSERQLPKIRPGDTIKVGETIVEATKEGKGEIKERVQYFEGDVIAMHKKGTGSTVTVRRIGANGVAVERIFPLHSEKFTFEFIREGDVRRAKLFYLRDRVGKQARVQEKVRTQAQKAKLEKRLNNAVEAQEEQQ